MKVYDMGAPLSLLFFAFLLLFIVTTPLPPSPKAAVAPVVVVHGADGSFYQSNYDVATLTLPDGRRMQAAFPSIGTASKAQATTADVTIFTDFGEIGVACTQGLNFIGYQQVDENTFTLRFRTRAGAESSLSLRFAQIE